MQLIKMAFIFGLLLTSVGLYLLMFTAVSEWGMNGLFLIVGLLIAGLLLLIPAKVYLIIILMNRTRQSKR